ncbi:MAG TPA: hypothetical protein VGN64_08980 [Dyadobacter sp.]|jgi:hypothetical protein|nr:hypothetical protein [Dyadobacter sp.]
MKGIFIAWIAILVSISCFGQQKEAFKRKYVNHTEVGVLLGQVKYGGGYWGGESFMNRQTITAQMYNGIQFDRSLSVGLTIGMDWYRSALMNPMALGIRYDILKGKAARLYASADAGYGFTWFNSNPEGYKTTGGLMLNPGIGIKFGKPDGAVATIGLGWRRQEAKVTKPPFVPETERVEKRVYNRLALRVGMSF